MFRSQIVPAAAPLVRVQRPAQRPFFFSRAMTSASNSKRKEFLCIMPDRPDVLAKRKKAKSGHYQGIQPLIAAGKLVDGGAIFAEHPQEGKDPQFLGSVVVYTGESIEDVRQIIKNDIYATSGVWDIEKVQIYPYMPAVRQPLP